MNAFGELCLLSIAVTDKLQGLFLIPQVPRAKALYTYRGHNPGELRFNKGDIIMLLRQLDENWYLGEVNGISGVFPASSVQVIKQLPLPASLGRALYSSDPRSRDQPENKDCLTLHKVMRPQQQPRWALCSFSLCSVRLLPSSTVIPFSAGSVAVGSRVALFPEGSSP